MPRLNTLADAVPYTPVINLVAVPLGAGVEFVAQEGTGTGSMLSTINQPQLEGGSTFRTPSANDLNESSLGTLASLVGMVVINAPYVFDGTNFLRTTGGLGTEDNPLEADVVGQDVRAFLYAVDAATATQAVRLLATAAGALNVATTIPGTITTVVDFTTSTTAASLIALNAARDVAIIQNLDATINVRVGDTNITSSRGILIGPGESVTLQTTAEIFVIAASGTPIVSRTEIET